jgi:hypothetical protein
MDLHHADPQLRSHATTLISAAESVENVSRSLTHHVAEMRFQGPAADRFRARAIERERALRQVAHALHEAARLVLQDTPTGGPR